VSKGFRQSQSFLHTWSGLLLGWVLFLVFVTGTIAFFREGMNRWMQPELPRVEQPMRSLAGAQRFLQDTAPDAQSWYIGVPNARGTGTQVYWVPAEKAGDQPRRRGRRDTQALIDANGEVTHARETRGGEFFYRFHFDLHYMPVIWARWLVGFAAMMMLVAILSGVVTHKKIFKDFFTLRRAKGQRSWLDGHNATAVLGLPFHLMITYTGLVTLMAMLMPWAMIANYVNQDDHFAKLFPVAEVVEPTGTRAPLVDLTSIVRDAERRLDAPVGSLDVSSPGDAAARITVSQAPSSMLSSRTPRLAYDGVTGKLLWESPPLGGGNVTAGAMIGLHAGRFAEIGLRWIYFLCGVAGSLMVASGLVMWIVKRREKLPDPTRPHLGFHIVERLNVATLGGFPLGIAAMFWANRLLPVGMEGRAEWEIHLLFITWAAGALLSLAVKPRIAWIVQLSLTGLLLAALPFYNQLSGLGGIVSGISCGDWLMAGVDLTLWAFAAGFFYAARRVARYTPPVRRERRARAAAAATPPAAAPVSEMEPAE